LSGFDTPRSFVPADIPVVFELLAVADIDGWVNTLDDVDPFEARPRLLRGALRRCGSR
jgi:hypothetical protein